jgi:hypothetical protein
MARAKKFLAFRIRLNGTKLVTAGLPGPHVVSTIISSVVRESGRAKSVRGEPLAKRELKLDVGGLVIGTEENVDWARVPLKMGDSITIDLIGTTTADEPRQRRKRSDSQKSVAAPPGATSTPSATLGQGSKRSRKPK